MVLHLYHDNTNIHTIGRLNTQPKKLFKILTEVFLEVFMTFHTSGLLWTTNWPSVCNVCARGAPGPDWRAWEVVTSVRDVLTTTGLWSGVRLSCCFSALYLCSSRQTIQHWTLRHSGTAATSSRFLLPRSSFQLVQLRGAGVGRSKHWRADHYWLLHPLTGTQLPADPSLFRLRWGVWQHNSDVGDKDGGNVGGPAETTWTRAGQGPGLGAGTLLGFPSGRFRLLCYQPPTIDLTNCLENIFPRKKSWNRLRNLLECFWWVSDTFAISKVFVCPASSWRFYNLFMYNENSFMS